MKTFINLAMVISLVAALVLLKKQIRAGAIVCLALVIFLAVGGFLFSSFMGTAGEIHLEKGRQVMTHGLAQKVAERHPYARVVVLGSPESSSMHRLAVASRETEAMLATALKRRGLQVESLPFPSKFGRGERPQAELDGLVDDQLDPDLAAALTMEVDVAEAGSLDQVLRSFKERADVVVLALPLGPATTPQDLPAKGEAPPLVLMNPPAWNDFPMAMKDTALDAVLMYRRDITKYVEKKWPRKDAEAFRQRFFFVTAENPDPDLQAADAGK